MENLEPTLRTVLPWLTGLSALAALAAMVVSFKHYRDARRACFFILRRRSQRKLRTGMGAMILFALLAAGLFIAPRAWPRFLERETEAAGTATVSLTPVTAVNSASDPKRGSPSPTVTPTPVGSPTVPFIPSNTPSLTPTFTATPSHTPTPTQTPTLTLTPSVTPTPSITPTPSPTVPVLQAILTPVTPFATVPAEAAIEELTVSRGVQLNGVAVNPGTEFAAGQSALYVSFDYSNMENGVLWCYIWYRDNVLFNGGMRLWEWGASGRTYFHLRPEGGFPPGEYEVQLLLDKEIVQTTEFDVSQ